jgi:hypothetical protein
MPAACTDVLACVGIRWAPINSHWAVGRGYFVRQSGVADVGAACHILRPPFDQGHWGARNVYVHGSVVESWRVSHNHTHIFTKLCHVLTCPHHENAHHVGVLMIVCMVHSRHGCGRMMDTCRVRIHVPRLIRITIDHTLLEFIKTTLLIAEVGHIVLISN